MFCTNCGKQIPESAKFCTNCGTKTLDTAHNPPDVQPPPSVPGPSASKTPLPPGPSASKTPPPPGPSASKTPPPPMPEPQRAKNPPPVMEHPGVQTAPMPEQNAGFAGGAPNTQPHRAPTVMLKKPQKKISPLIIVAIVAAALIFLCACGGLIYLFLFARGGGEEVSQPPTSTETAGETGSEPDIEAYFPEESSPAPAQEPYDVLPENLPDPPFNELPEVSPEQPPAERDFIIPDSSTRLLSEYELEQYSNAELVIARNEIYARHGYEFGSKILAEWFARKPWYAVNDNFAESQLNQTERSNITLLRDYKLGRDNGEYIYWGEGAADLFYYRYFIDSNQRYIQDWEVADMTKDNLEIAIEEIRASNGIMYDNTKWREYYKSFTWYNPTIPESTWDDSILNQYDRYNIELLRNYLQSA